LIGRRREENDITKGREEDSSLELEFNKETNSESSSSSSSSSSFSSFSSSSSPPPPPTLPSIDENEFSEIEQPSQLNTTPTHLPTLLPPSFSSLLPTDLNFPLFTSPTITSTTSSSSSSSSTSSSSTTSSSHPPTFLPSPHPNQKMYGRDPHRRRRRSLGRRETQG
jgi:hypothetical protein